MIGVPESRCTFCGSSAHDRQQCDIEKIWQQRQDEMLVLRYQLGGTHES